MSHGVSFGIPPPVATWTSCAGSPPSWQRLCHAGGPAVELHIWNHHRGGKPFISKKLWPGRNDQQNG